MRWKAGADGDKTLDLKVEAAIVNIQEIVGAIQASRVRIAEHADEEAEAEAISLGEIYRSVMLGEIY